MRRGNAETFAATPAAAGSALAAPAAAAAAGSLACSTDAVVGPGWPYTAAASVFMAMVASACVWAAGCAAGAAACTASVSPAAFAEGAAAATAAGCAAGGAACACFWPAGADAPVMTRRMQPLWSTAPDSNCRSATSSCFATCGRHQREVRIAFVCVAPYLRVFRVYVAPYLRVSLVSKARPGAESVLDQRRRHCCCAEEVRNMATF